VLYGEQAENFSLNICYSVKIDLNPIMILVVLDYQ